MTTPERGSIEYAEPLLYFTNSEQRYPICLEMTDITVNNQSISTTAFTNVNDIQISFSGAGGYIIECQMYLSSIATSGLRFRYVLSGGTVGSTTSSSYFDSVDSGTTVSVNLHSGTGFDTIEGQYTPTATDSGVFRGTMSTTISTAGTLYIQAARVNNTATNSTISVNSFVRVKLIS
jgi:hypothetical protein